MKKTDNPLDPELENRLEIFKEVPERDTAAAARGRMQFLQQVGGLRARSVRRSHSRQAPRFGLFRPVSSAPRRSLAMNFIRAAGLILLILFGGGTLTVYASQGSLPGESLYPLKTLSEDALLSLTSSPEKRVNLNMEFADRRLTEMAELQTAGRPIPQEVADRYNGEVDQTLELASGMEEPAMVQSLQIVTSRAEKQLKTMDGLIRGNSNPHVIVEARNHLQERANEAQQGQVDPQSFRQHRQGNSHQQPGISTNSTPTPAPGPTIVAPPSNPSDETPLPPENNPGPTPGIHGPEQTKKPHHGGGGGNGGGSGP
jgi:Domain of unknown function (DUF5667)